MYKRIIVAVGDYPEWDSPVAYGIALAAQTEAELCLLRVLTVPFVASAPDMVASSTLAMEQLLHANEHILGCAMTAANQAGVVSTCVLHWGAFPEMLRRTAEEVESDLVIVGAPTCPGWRRGLSGYIARKLLTQTPCPLLIVPSPSARHDAVPLWLRLLAVHDGSVAAANAVDYAAQLAYLGGFDLCKVHVDHRSRTRSEVVDDDLEDSAQEGRRSSRPSALLSMGSRLVSVPRYEAATLLALATSMLCDVLVLKAAQSGGWRHGRYRRVLNRLLALSDIPLLLIPS